MWATDRPTSTPGLHEIILRWEGYMPLEDGTEGMACDLIGYLEWNKVPNVWTGLGKEVID